jgi:hypothetical protein
MFDISNFPADVSDAGELMRLYSILRGESVQMEVELQSKEAGIFVSTLQAHLDSPFHNRLL